MEVAEVKEGLRASKKRRTREAIAAAAMKLFSERGFDAVTVAEVAAAADVSEKTVFNYFPAKEDLVLSRGEERRLELIEAIRSRAPGETITAPFRRQAMDFLDDVEAQPVEATIAVPRLVMASDVLRDRLLLSFEREAAQLAPAIAEVVGAKPDDVVVGMVGRTLAWTVRDIFRATIRRLIAGEPKGKVVADLRVQANRAFDQLERGFADYGRAA
jgi:AcrR family transcriptional regulator